MVMKTTLVVPLGHGSVWDNNELRYMLRSMDKNLSGNINVVIYYSGNPEKMPDFLQNVKIKTIQRHYPSYALGCFGGAKHYENYFDVLHKLREVVNDPIISEEFLWIYDDIILLKKIKQDFLRKKIAITKLSDKRIRLFERGGKWGRTIHAATKLLNKPCFMYETHLPRWYKKSVWREIFEKYDWEKMRIPYAPATMYYNYMGGKPDLLMENDRTLKVGFYGGQGDGLDGFSSHVEKDIKTYCDNAIWMNYSNRGLRTKGSDGSEREYLKEYIVSTFNEKSKFEK